MVLHYNAFTYSFIYPFLNVQKNAVISVLWPGLSPVDSAGWITEQTGLG